MAWPVKPETLVDLPIPSPIDKLIDTFESINPGTGKQVCEYVGYCHNELEAITEGDPEKEKKLGQLLVVLAYRSANYALPEELKDLRYDIAMLEVEGFTED